MSDTAKVIFGAFMAFFCLFLGGWMLLRDHPILAFVGAFFAASGATFFFVFFFKK